MFEADKHSFKPFEKTVYLSSPTPHRQQGEDQCEELTYIKEAFDTNWLSTVGKNIDEAERMIAEKAGMRYAVGLSSGTAALHMAVKLAGVSQGSICFASDMTFGATVNPIVYEGGTPVFIDTEYDTWNMDPLALEKAFERYPANAKVIVMAHLYGTPGKLDELKAVADKYKAVFIEDAAESLGASYKGACTGDDWKPTGAFGDVACISCNGNKIITGSSGGFLLTDNEEDAKKVKKWSTQSREDAPWYQHEEVGYNYRMSNLVAGMIRGQIPYLEKHIEQKKAVWERYKEGFKELPVSMNPIDFEKSRPNYWLSCITVNPDAMCRQVRDDHEALYIPEHGKSCPTEILEALERIRAQGRPIWKPLHMQPMYRGNGFVTREDRSAGEDIFDRGLCLPSDNKMSEEEQDRIIEVVKSCFA
ncbi:MAG: DegT/DnrJ/EryC1/StrS family aminotransferase [Muribaculaceae bacterium]|nr:DegT/DnrJ/EryC1/StrS family aminotransferase [Roseburia sp.]MCM1432118.1 DegT/DnrJ/EryC1/StrS family aminotransferase [Muribaculaceae bacterium]MCM1493985.1 DegT/DnrJ/EryC1/StrS family aminotransferase [Muribaculaceae bacterium]